MLALYFDGNLELKELPRPQPGAGEVLIRVHLAGVCRTDLEVLRGYHAFRGVPGREFLGTGAGPQDSPWLGRRVVGEINVSCLECDRCRRGLTNHCRRRLVLGLNGRDGAFAQYLTLPERNLHPVPPEVPDEVAVFTEPLAAALRVLDVVQPIPPQTRVLVVGDGSLGLQASWVLARPRGGPQGAWGLKRPYVGRYPLDPATLVVPEVRLLGSRCGPFPEALRWLREGRVDPRPLINRTFPLAQGLEALAWAQRSGTLQVLLDCREAG